MRLCERFGCLPSALLDEPADVIRLVALYDLGQPPERSADDHGQ